MKSWLAILLALMLALTAAVGFGEDNLYLPGQTSLDLMLQSLEFGRHLGVNVSAIFAPGDAMAGDEDVYAQLTAVGRMLDNSALRLGFARTEDGPRFELGGYCIGEDGNLVYIDNAVTVNRQGLMLETDLLPGRRFTANWETVLTYCGVDEETAAAALSWLREKDYKAMLEKLVSEHLPMLIGKAAAVAAPYETAMRDWVDTLDIETVDHVDGSAIIPTIPGMKQVTVSAADVKRLAAAMMDQFEQDDALKGILNLFLACVNTDTSSDPAFDSDDLIGFAKMLLSDDGESEEAADPESPVLITYRSDAASHTFIFDIRQADLGFSATLVCLPADAENTVNLAGSFACTLDGTQAAATLDAEAAWDPADPLLVRVEGVADITVDGVLQTSLSYNQNGERFVAESGQPGYRLSKSSVVVVPEADAPDGAEDAGQSPAPLTTTSESSVEWVLTAEGGESYLAHGTVEAKTGDSTSDDAIVDEYWSIEPTEDGQYDAYYSTTASFPSGGIDMIGFSALIFGDEYEPMDSFLETVVIEDLDGDGISILMDEAKANARMMRNQLLEVIPAELREDAVQIIGGTYVSGGDPDEAPENPYMDGYTAGYGEGYDAGFRAALDYLRGEELHTGPGGAADDANPGEAD